MPEEELDALLEVIKKNIDANADGTITVAEFGAIAKDVEMLNSMQAMVEGESG